MNKILSQALKKAVSEFSPNVADTKKESRLEKYKALLKFRNIPFDADLFTWSS